MAGGAGQLIRPDQFANRIARAQRWVFRLETRRDYREPSEAEWLQEFLRGEPYPPECPEQDAWEQMLRDGTRAGTLYQRVHVVAEPLADYLRFELCWAYPPNAAAGEQIRIVDASHGWPGGVPTFDFWVLDGDRYDALYDDDGRFLGARWVGWTPTTQRWCRAAVRRSVPLRDYLAARPELASRVVN